MSFPEILDAYIYLFSVDQLDNLFPQNHWPKSQISISALFTMQLMVATVQQI